MIADRIKTLRKRQGISQSELAKKLGITRSSVNAWEMGISVPSTQYIVELTNIFHVSADYLLEIDSFATLNISGLSDKDVEIVHSLIEHLRARNHN